MAELRGFAKCARIALDDGLDDVAAVIAKRARTASSISRAIDILRENWAPHWRRMSTPEQVAKLLDEAAVKQRLVCEADRATHRARARASLARLELKRRGEEEPTKVRSNDTSLAARTVARDAHRADTVLETPMNGPWSRRKIGDIRRCLTIEVSR